MFSMRFGNAVEQRRSDESHEAGKTDEIHAARFERVGHRAIVRVAPRVVARPEAHRLNPGVARPLHACGIVTVRNDDRDLRVEPALADRVDDRLQVGSPPRDEHAKTSPKRGRTPFLFLALSLRFEPVRKDRDMPQTTPHCPAGFVYHVMNRAAGRLVLFETPSDYIAFEHILSLGQHRTGMRILAYCLMRNHWHLLLARSDS